MAKIVIYGAGLTGCYIGGRLLAGGSDVSFIGGARMADQLRREGITLSRHDNCRAQPDATGDRTLRRLLCPRHCVGRFFRPYAGE